jgi:hypothetical protein
MATVLQTRFECTVMHFSEIAFKCLSSDCSNSQAYRARKKFRYLPGQFMGPAEIGCELIDVRGMCRDWSCASQKTHRTSVTKFSRLMLFKEAVSVYHVSQVEVTLRPTVSRPVRLGVLPLLDGSVICSAMTQVQFQVTLRPTVCRPVRLGAGSPNEDHNQFLIPLFDSHFVFSV